MFCFKCHEILRITASDVIFQCVNNAYSCTCCSCVYASGVTEGVGGGVIVLCVTAIGPYRGSLQEKMMNRK